MQIYIYALTAHCKENVGKKRLARAGPTSIRKEEGACLTKPCVFLLWNRLFLKCEASTAIDILCNCPNYSLT